MATASTETAESYQPLGKPERVDREKGMIANVRLVGPESLNGGTYPAAVLERDKGKYDNLPVYVDLGHHQTAGANNNIPVVAKFGRTINPRVVNGGLHADLEFNPKHSFAEEFCWACENNPSLYGFSQFANVKWVNQPAGSRTAESIVKPHRIDIVGMPATTSSVFESKGPAVETDPRMIASTITSPDALKTFLTSLFDGLPSGSFTNEAKAACLNDLMTKYGDSDVDPAADPDAAVESLASFGKVGVWARDFIAESRATAAKAERLTKAGELCDAEKLPAHLKTATFVELVAESIGTPEKAKALIADRIAVGKPATTGGSGNTSESVGGGAGSGGAKTTDRGDGKTKKSVADIVGEYAGGRK